MCSNCIYTEPNLLSSTSKILRYLAFLTHVDPPVNILLVCYWPIKQQSRPSFYKTCVRCTCLPSDNLPFFLPSSPSPIRSSTWNLIKTAITHATKRPRSHYCHLSVTAQLTGEASAQSGGDVSKINQELVKIKKGIVTTIKEKVTRFVFDSKRRNETDWKVWGKMRDTQKTKVQRFPSEENTWTK